MTSFNTNIIQQNATNLNSLNQKNYIKIPILQSFYDCKRLTAYIFNVQISANFFEKVKTTFSRFATFFSQINFHF